MEEVLIAFDSTHDAILSETLARDLKLKARLIPTPEKISASCGLALKLLADDLKTAEASLKNNQVHSGKAYEIKIENGTKEYKIIEAFQLK